MTIDRVMRAALALVLLAAGACASGAPAGTRPASRGAVAEPITVHPSQIFEDVPQGP
jgi:hypothetical protein